MTAGLNHELMAYVAATLDYFKIPGAMLTVVKGPETVLAPFGNLRADGHQAVNQETLFPLLSCAESYAAAAAAILVDEGQLDWDRPVAQDLPEFVLSDPWITRNLTIRDLLSQRLQLAPADGFDGHWITRPASLARLSDLKDATRVTGFRERYAPLPIAFTAVAEIVARASGQNFADFLQHRLFEPLALARTLVTDSWPTDPTNNIVHPHDLNGDTACPVDAPSCGGHIGDLDIFASGADSATWMRLNLRRGFFDRTPVIKWPSMIEMQTPHSVAVADERRGELLAGQGMGWRVTTYSSSRILVNEGHCQGTSAFHLLLPRENLGIAVHLGLSCPPAARGITYRLLDAFLGRPAIDWAPKFKTWAQEDRDAEEARREQV